MFRQALILLHFLPLYSYEVGYLQKFIRAVTLETPARKIASTKNLFTLIFKMLGDPQSGFSKKVL